MRSENKRVFINDLPETVTSDELVTNFAKYGQVSSVEIKERKELGPSNKSLFFAYVNLNTDDKGINQCFQEISNTKWHGQYVQLQIARENFLQRLRREREESQNNNKNNIALDDIEETVKPDTKQHLNYGKTLKASPEVIHKIASKKYNSSTESESAESDSKSDSYSKKIKIKKNSRNTKIETVVSESEEITDIVIKSNRGKFIDKNGLKIPSVGKEPIIQVTNTKNKINDSEANLKRLQSLQDMKKNYAAQKSLIKNSLSYGITKPNSKIVFDDIGADISSKPKFNGLQNNTLFDEDNTSEDNLDFEPNFELKEQFQGTSGQKLLELQSKYKNDRRFALDKRFMEVENEEDIGKMETEDISAETLEAEKRDQLKILEGVLGKNITTSKHQGKKDGDKKKTMLRFDPSQPEHSNLEVTVNNTEEKAKKNKKDRRKEVQENFNLEPEVSKEVFYKVTDNLKETLEEKQQFSLLSMFGKVEENKGDIQETTEKQISPDPFIKGQNPFKYDSSDDDNDTEDIPHKSEIKNSTQNTSSGPKTTRASAAVFWTEPFFFKPDDFRLQEGFDFIEKMKTENKEFVKIRRELKGIIKAKIRNNERKNKMFKKKLGGSKRRKHIRIKKALKR